MEDSEYVKAKIEAIKHFTTRGYNKEMVIKSFEKAEKNDRKTLIYKSKHDTKQNQKICYPLICDYNPALPNTNKVINNHKYLLDLDPQLQKIILKENVFVSFRAAPTLRDMLIHSKLPSLNQDTTSPTTGCFPCKKGCHLCKNYLKAGSIVKSHHNNRTFFIKQYIDCFTPNVVYLVNDDTCKLSNVGCTTDGMNTRWSNHKSHIKNGIRTCELVNHIIDNPQNHVLDKTTSKMYDTSLSNGITIFLLESVKVDPNDDKIERLKKCKVREGWWQKQLCTMEISGGLNKRDSQKESTDQSR